MFNNSIVVQPIFWIAGDMDKYLYIEEFVDEALLMHNLQHPNILQLITLIVKDNVPYIIHPFMDNGNLRGYVKNKSNVSLPLRYLNGDVLLNLKVIEGL